jgi:hypothetical protein
MLTRFEVATGRPTGHTWRNGNNREASMSRSWRISQLTSGVAALVAYIYSSVTTDYAISCAATVAWISLGVICGLTGEVGRAFAKQEKRIRKLERQLRNLTESDSAENLETLLADLQRV